MTSAVIPVPKPLNISDGNRSLSWELFKQTWTNYELATGLRTVSEEQRLATLLSVIGTEALIVYNAFTWSTEETQTVEIVLVKFEAYCKPKRNIAYERYLFMSRKQKSTEKIEDYIVALRNLIIDCKYEHLADSILRDQIIMGVHSSKVRESLLKEQDLTLDKCVNIARAIERTKEHISAFTEDQRYEEPMEIDKVSQERFRQKCKFCGFNHELSRDKCPATGKSCHKCGKSNHFSRMCKEKSSRSREVKYVFDDSEEEFRIE